MIENKKFKWTQFNPKKMQLQFYKRNFYENSKKKKIQKNLKNILLKPKNDNIIELFKGKYTLRSSSLSTDDINSLSKIRNWNSITQS